MIKKYTDLFFSNFKSITSSKFFKVFLWDVLSKGLDFLLLPIYLKILLPSEYGFYTFLLYIITTIAGVLKLGLDTSLSKMYYETEKYDRGEMLFSLNFIWILLFISLVSISLIFGVDKVLFEKLLSISDKDFLQVRYFIFAYILFSLVQTTLNVFFVIDDSALLYQKYNFVRIVGGNLIVILLIIFYVRGNKAYFRVSLEPIIYLTSFLPLIIIFVKRMTLKINWNALKHAMKIGLPMVGTLVVGVIYNISDKYFLQKASGYEALAIYNLALYLTLPISLIFMSFNTVWLPQFFKEKSSLVNFKKSNNYLLQLSILYLFLLFLIEILLIIFLKLGLINNTYFSILLIFPVVFVAKIADSVLQMYNNFIIAWGRTIFNLLISIVFSVFTLSLNWIIIPIYGIYGVISVLICISFIRLTVFYLFVKRNIVL